MAFRSGQKINFMIDMTEINRLIGLAYATKELGTGSKYMQSIISSAFEDTNEDFNRQTAAITMATGQYKHMYEWGTMGVNPKSFGKRPKAVSEAARLWKTIMLPGRAMSSITFTYKPSLVTVPVPTVKKTGIPSATLKKLNRDHVFTNKAMVFESGMTVHVKRINAKALFIPLRYLGQKGYMMRLGPTNPTPGRKVQGTFTAWFKTFWEGQGNILMQEHAVKFFQLDLDREIARINMSSRGMPISPVIGKQQEQIRASQRTVLKNMERHAKERAVGE